MHVAGPLTAICGCWDECCHRDHLQKSSVSHAVAPISMPVAPTWHASAMRKPRTGRGAKPISLFATNSFSRVWNGLLQTTAQQVFLKLILGIRCIAETATLQSTNDQDRALCLRQLLGSSKCCVPDANVHGKCQGKTAQRLRLRSKHAWSTKTGAAECAQQELAGVTELAWQGLRRLEAEAALHDA